MSSYHAGDSLSGKCFYFCMGAGSDTSTTIWCKNAATYSLYKYTPYTCTSNDSTHSANVLFLEIYDGKMLSDFPS